MFLISSILFLFVNMFAIILVMAQLQTKWNITYILNILKWTQQNATLKI